MSDTTLNVCWLCDRLLPDGVHICSACENELNRDFPPKDYDNEDHDDGNTSNESEGERVRAEDTRTNGT